MIAPSHVPGAGAQDWLLANRRRECDSPLIFVINYAPHQSQCRVRLPIANLREWCLQDQLSDQSHHWNDDELAARGLFVDHVLWQAAVFSLKEQ